VPSTCALNFIRSNKFIVGCFCGTIEFFFFQVAQEIFSHAQALFFLFFRLVAQESFSNQLFFFGFFVWSRRKLSATSSLK